MHIFPGFLLEAEGRWVHGHGHRRELRDPTGLDQGDHRRLTASGLDYCWDNHDSGTTPQGVAR
jgi:hypothetical protein